MEPIAFADRMEVSVNVTSVHLPIDIKSSRVMNELWTFIDNAQCAKYLIL